MVQFTVVNFESLYECLQLCSIDVNKLPMMTKLSQFTVNFGWVMTKICILSNLTKAATLWRILCQKWTCMYGYKETSFFPVAVPVKGEDLYGYYCLSCSSSESSESTMLLFDWVGCILCYLAHSVGQYKVNVLKDWDQLVCNTCRISREFKLILSLQKWGRFFSGMVKIGSFYVLHTSHL